MNFEVRSYNALVPPFERHVFVCLNQRDPGHQRGCCSDKGSREIREKMKALAEAGIHVVKSPADIGKAMKEAL